MKPPGATSNATVREFMHIITAQAKAALASLEKPIDKPGLLQLSRLHPSDDDGSGNAKPVPSRFMLDDVERMIEAAVTDSENGHNAYIEGRTVREGLQGRQRGGFEDTVAVFAYVVDGDADKGLGWTPSVPVSLTTETSPGNFHHWLFLKQAITDWSIAKALGDRIRAAVRADHDTGTITQPYRIAGTVNYPGAKKIERGRVTVPTRIVEFDPEALWTREDIEQEFPIPERPEATGNGTIRVGDFVQWISGDVEQFKPPRQVTKIDAGAGYAWVDGSNTGIPINELTVVAAGTADEASIPADTLRVIREGVANADRSHAFWNVLVVLKADGWTVDGIVALLERYPAGIAAKYRGRLQREVERVCGKISGGGQAAPAPSEPLFDPWERYIVPPFPLDVLPETVKDYATEQSALIGCDESAFAMSVLATFSGALHHDHQLKMMRNGAWYERPRLWVLLVGDPSQRKTPIFNTVTKPLVHYETHLRVKHEHDLRDYALALKEQGGDHASKPQEPEPPPRYVVWDTTVEKLGELLARGDGKKGLLVKSDEISGWLGSMERYSGASGGRSERGFWLCAYDGGPHSIDRIKRGEMFIKNLSISLLGGIQPARLAELQGLTSDGLLQRLIPVMMTSASFPLDHPGDGEAYSKLVRELIFSKPARLIMTDDALLVMEKLRHHLFNLEQASGGISPGFQTFAGKMHGVCGSLALILHMAHNPEIGTTVPVEADTIEKLRRLVVDFILPHAFEFYRGAEAEGERLRRLASWILTSGKTQFLASDLARNIRDFRGLTLVEINERVSPLVAAGWLQPADTTPVCRSWTVTPQVHLQLAERAKTEEVRKAALAALMGSPRK